MTQTHGPGAGRNVDPAEIAKFDALASRWWDPEGEFRPLHEMNPLRLAWIDRRCGGLNGLRAVDIGCGGGILAESMAVSGATVTGADLAAAPLTVAKLHLLETGNDVEYLQIAAEELAAEREAQYDVVTCMEMLEHVPDPASIINACCRLAKPGGDVFFSTINRNPKAFFMAIVGAEYLMRLLPRGTHEYARFIKPSELEAWARAAGLSVAGITGMHYNPLSPDKTRRFSSGGNVDVNYLMHFRRPA
ncbi:MAG TPA: bifunctional 2-polyprenyl-6-hydroxyphenol methylase/3-demethylubiquinol 3-O-methyltransferase UbiG [Gammaproteobacteria bacterium]